MPFQSCPTIAEAVIHATISAQPIANVLHFRKPGGYDEDDIQSLATAVANSIDGGYQALCHVGVDIDSVTTRGLENIVDFAGAEAIVNGTGTGTGSSMPSNQAFCVTLRSAQTGRSARGRVYLFPTSDDQFNTVDVLGTSYTAAAENLVGEIKDNAAVQGWIMVVLSRFSNKALRLFGVGYDVVDVIARNAITDSQRGRLPHGH